MPTYEYACKRCGHTFEIVQSFKDDTLTVCPECGGELRKVFTPPAITFKGSGFYATDHGKKSKSSGSGGKTEKEKKEPSKASSSEGGSSSGSSGSTSGSSDSSGSSTSKKEGSSS
jgi:putative FmdB family regulatory protein